MKEQICPSHREERRPISGPSLGEFKNWKKMKTVIKLNIGPSSIECKDPFL